MKKEIIASGKDLNEAKENARLALGAGELDDVTFEIIDLGSKGIFGVIGVRPTKVKASMELPDPTPRREKPVSGERREKKGDAPRKREAKPQKEGKKEQKKAKAQPSKPAAVPENDLEFTHVDAQPGDDRAFDFINRLVDNLGVEGVSTELLKCSDGTRRISIKGENAALLIGHHGDTLDSLQYLANLACSQPNAKGEKDRSRVTIDVEGYRAKREETLRKLANRMANKALAKGSKVTLEPMSPYERRIIHSEIQAIEGVTTQSIGSDSSRRIVIYVDRPTKKSKDPEVRTEEADEADV